MSKPSNNSGTPPSKKTFDEWYQEVPPWDIGHPQKAFMELETDGKLSGRILDVGCGTGENALFLSSKGHHVSGVDFSPTAIQKAKLKAKERGLTTHFQVCDALKLESLYQTFDCIIDSGLFHCFTDEERPLFVNQLSKVLTKNGTYHFLCFSDKELRDGGPRRISKSEIAYIFTKGWKQLSLKEVFFENTLHEGGSKALLASLQRITHS